MFYLKVLPAALRNVSDLQCTKVYDLTMGNTSNFSILNFLKTRRKSRSSVFPIRTFLQKFFNVLKDLWLPSCSLESMECTKWLEQHEQESCSSGCFSLELSALRHRALRALTQVEGRKGGFPSAWQRLALVILQRVHQGQDGVGARFSRSSSGQGTADSRKQGMNNGGGSERERSRGHSL